MRFGERAYRSQFRAQFRAQFRPNYDQQFRIQLLWISAWQMPGVKFCWHFFSLRVAKSIESRSSKTDGAQVIARGLFEEREKAQTRKGCAETHIGSKKIITKGYTRVPLGTPGYSGVPWSTSGYPGVPPGPPGTPGSPWGPWGTLRTLGYPGKPWGIPRDLGFTEGYFWKVPQGYPGVPRKFGLGRGVFPPLVCTPKLDLKTP